ncbi:MAG: hypothetical protein N4A61_14170 [Pelagimonas sp.]|jgi:hypothetical protein|nr:hypothetical protein [Pelagimonas sp.]
MRTETPNLTQQQIRSRLVNMLTMAASFETIARFGAVEILNMVEDYLPLSQDIPLTEDELEALDIFGRRMGDANDITAFDIQMVDVLALSPQWRAVRDWARTALECFLRDDPHLA